MQYRLFGFTSFYIIFAVTEKTDNQNRVRICRKIDSNSSKRVVKIDRYFNPEMNFACCSIVCYITRLASAISIFEIITINML